jgi:biopolymer transport protein ExbB
MSHLRIIPILILLLATLYQPALAQVGGYPGARGAPPPSGYGVQPSYNLNANTGGTGLPMASQPAARIASLPVTGGQTGVTGGQTSSNLASEASQQATIRTNGLLSILREGGVLMYPILLCSFILMVFVLERLLYLRRSRVIPKPFVRGVIEQLEQQQLGQDEALELCEANGSPVAELFTAALKRWNRPAVEMEQAAMDAGAHITSRLRKYLRLFNAISNMTPLLGLLGTVLGMIDAFNSIAQADAMGRPELLAGGIGTALLTTAFGLCVAIPAYAAYVYFLGRTDKLILEMDALVANVIELTSAESQQNSRSRSRSRKAA